MPIDPGSRLGPYEVVSPLGAGGMGEVYRAKDTRLDREVAIKVLPEHLSSSADLRARFEREARAISTLNHPHICVLHDVGNDHGIEYLVMELVEGETLDQRIRKGPLPVEQILKLGVEIASALDKAHRGGIVHRDLKPSNIMMTASGAKLMDFGLAKATGATAAASGSVSAMSAAVTMTTPTSPVTSAGTVVGTFEYMSPEQVEGKEADGRSDLFAFGAVLYEMATGRRAFTGKSQLSVASAILEKEPDPISTIAPLTPPALERVIQQCLAKDPEERWQNARDVMMELKWIQESGSKAGVPAVVKSHRKHREWLAWGLAAAAWLVAIALGWHMLRPEKTVQVQRTTILPGSGTVIDPTSMALSPDGSKLVYSARKRNGELSLWVRPLNALSAQELAGTINASYPFWSPDNRYIGFFANSKLRKVEASGGAVTTICDAPSGRGGTWNQHGVIVFAPAANGGLYQVSEDGGMPTEVWTTDKNSSDRFPWFLPDGKTFLFYLEDKDLSVRLSRLPSDKRSGIYVMRLGDKAPKLLVQGDTAAEYVESGYMFYIREDNLLAAKFDTSTLKLIGSPVPVADRVASEVTRQAGAFTVSQNGQIVYSEDLSGQSRILEWYDRTGKKLEPPIPPAPYYFPRISPDGERVVYSIPTSQGGGNIWIRDLKRGTQSRFTFSEEDNNHFAVWSRDGKRIVYTSNKGLMVKDASGVGTEELLAGSETLDGPMDWTNDGKTLLFVRASAAPSHLWTLDLQQKRARDLTHSNFFQANARFSPDGKWVAFQASDTGTPQIYVMPFPGLDGKYQMSVKDGVQPVWGPDGKELFFIATDGTLMRVPIQNLQPFTAGNPEPLFPTRVVATRSTNTEYDIARDGKRFLINSRSEEAREIPLVLVNNWQTGLKK